MWKWIGGIFLLVVLCLAGAIWAGYRKLTTGGDAASVTIAGSPDRVFAALATHDSLASWWALRGTPVVRHGPFAVGDSIPMQTSRSAVKQRLSNWVVDQVAPGRLLVLSLRNDSTGVVVAVRRDSLVGRGDSTEIVSTISSPMMDNVRAQNPNGAGLIGVSSKLVVSAMRLQSQAELTRLKNHVEGRAVDAQP